MSDKKITDIIMENNKSEEYQNLLKSMILINEELTRNRIQLENTSNVLEKSLYKLTHDLYSPLSNVEGLINILKLNGCESIESNKAIIDMIADAVLKFKIRIKEINNVSSIFHNTKTVEEYKLFEIFEQISKRLQTSITSSGIIIHTEFILEKNTLCYESNYCILNNLISQALRVVPENIHSEITIRSYLDGEYEVIEMKEDNNQESLTYLNNLMNTPSYDDTSNQINGLYIIKKIAECSGGGVKLESIKGEGIIYKIFFK